MATKPYQSKLIPFEDEIRKLRRRRPPVTYEQIAELLRQKHGLTIQRAAICKFLKVRSGGRKVYYFTREVAEKEPTSVLAASEISAPGSHLAPKPKFEFTHSERYNLTRLPPEVAAARRKKLEEEGH